MPNRKPSPLYKWATSFGRKTTLHRAIVERSLGYPLPYEMHVHHINGDKTDNRLENLEVVPAKAHGLMHSPPQLPVTKTCEVCGIEFRPHKTKRRRAKTCGGSCARLLAARNRRKFTDNQISEMRELRRGGMTQWDIAKRFGSTQGAVWPYLRDC